MRGGGATNPGILGGSHGGVPRNLGLLESPEIPMLPPETATALEAL